MFYRHTTVEANVRLVLNDKPKILVPILSKNGTDAKLLDMIISENEIRTEDSAVNRAEKMSKLKAMGYTNKQIAVTFGLSRQSVENALSMDTLSDDIKEAVENGAISPTAALEVRNLPVEEQADVLQYLEDSNIKPTVPVVREIVEPEIYKEVDSDVDDEYSADDISNDAFEKPVVNRYESVTLKSIKSKPLPKKSLEKRLELFEIKGFASDRYLQSKPVDFQAGFEYALKWALGREQEEGDFEADESEGD
jgi:hypothetical protein